MTDEPDLFNLDEARGARDEGMKRAELHAAPGFCDFMFALVIEVARRQLYFNADHVWMLCQERDGPTTLERRAFGSVMQRAAKAGVCVKAERPPVPTARRSNHARPLQVWR